MVLPTSDEQMPSFESHVDEQVKCRFAFLLNNVTSENISSIIGEILKLLESKKNEEYFVGVLVY